MGKRTTPLALALVLTACAGAGTTGSTSTDPSTRSTADDRVAAAPTATPATSTSTSTTWPANIPTAEEMLSDEEVTEGERELARWAVFMCVDAAGADTTFELYDVDPVVSRDYGPALQECRLPYVGLYRENRMPGDQFDLGLLGVVACTEAQTGADYGPKTIDDIGRLTPESHRTITHALNTDRTIYQSCYFDLYIDEERTVTDVSIVAYRLDDQDPRRLGLTLDSCGYVAVGELVDETEHSVIASVSTTFIEGGPEASCELLHPIRLRDPLGDRSVVDAGTGTVVGLGAGG
jgi:hypothetical protein